MNNTDTEKLLTARGIRPTPNRILVARALAEATAPVALSTLETLLDTVERSTIFRVLNLFRSADLVHAIDDGSGSTKYELCRDTHACTPAHFHTHFHCTGCGDTVCLTDIPIPEVTLPDGYTAHDINYVVTGLCPRCSAKNGSAK